MEQSKTFEASVQRLEEIVRRMESGELPLEEALSLFGEGTALVKSANALLDAAELTVVKLKKGADGAPEEMEFESHE